jgi:hypothetical protein
MHGRLRSLHQKKPTTTTTPPTTDLHQSYILAGCKTLMSQVGKQTEKKGKESRQTLENMGSRLEPSRLVDLAEVWAEPLIRREGKLRIKRLEARTVIMVENRRPGGVSGALHNLRKVVPVQLGLYPGSRDRQRLRIVGRRGCVIGY